MLGLKLVSFITAPARPHIREIRYETTDIFHSILYFHYKFQSQTSGLARTCIWPADTPNNDYRVFVTICTLS